MFWPRYRVICDRIGADVEHGSLYVGSPETVATKVAANIRLLGLSRFDLAYATGAVPHEQRMAMIELYGREVIPRVRELLEHPPVLSVPSGQQAAIRAESRVS